MRNNIFLIVADQFRADCIGYDGNQFITTPNLNQLASDGCFFRRGYSPCPVCVPARACMITGHKPSKTGFFNNDFKVNWEFRESAVERLRNSGYQTMNIGKNHFKPRRLGLGYEVNLLYETEPSEDGVLSDYHEWLASNAPNYIQDTAFMMNRNSWIVKPWTAAQELHPTEWTSRTARSQVLKRDRNRPLFMKLSFHRPHPPIDPPVVYWDKYKDKELPGPSIGDWAPVFEEDTDCLFPFEGKINERMLKDAKRGYYAQIEHIDSQIGCFIDFLKAEKLYDESLIIFTADHGEMLGDHNMFRKGPPYEGSARVPFIVKFPKSMNLKGKFDIPVSLLDIAPTFLEIAQIDVPADYDGISLVDLLNNPAKRRAVIGECYRKNALVTTGGMYSVDERFKYVWDSWKGEEHLFDLKEDPNELRDLSSEAQYHERKDSLKAYVIEEYRSRPEDGMIDGNGNLVSGKVLPHYRKP